MSIYNNIKEITMFTVIKTQIIAQSKNSYLSFPDIIQSPYNPDKLFIVYRKGDGHHPYKSSLIVMESVDRGEKWEEIHVFKSSLKKEGRVWNCPRLSYTDSEKEDSPFLNIVCDTKNSTRERTATFSTIRLISQNDGETFLFDSLPFIGMVPDKMIKFKDRYFCANHKIKHERSGLIQLVNWNKKAKDEIWYDCNVIAHSSKKQYCEASLVNVNDEYLIAYLRDNSGHFKKIDYTKSSDGIFWDKPKSLKGVWGQRVTAIKDGDRIIGSYRNTVDKRVSIFTHPINKEDEIKIYDIDQEYDFNLYHFGYTGIVKIAPDSFLVVYYIRNDEKYPFIKLAYLKET